MKQKKQLVVFFNIHVIEVSHTYCELIEFYEINNELPSKDYSKKI